MGVLRVVPCLDAVDVEWGEARGINGDRLGAPCYAHVEALVGLHVELLSCCVHEEDILA